MRRVPALLLVAMTTVAAAPGGEHALQPSAEATATTSPPPTSRSARLDPSAELPGFAAVLDSRPAIVGPDAWRPLSHDEAWSALAGSRPDTRQAARWNYARSLIAAERGDDAAGVLAVMVQDDPDLALVSSWQIARGAALADAGLSLDALAVMNEPALAANAEACLWRMLAFADAGFAEKAMSQLGCALPALNARPAGKRARFVRAASDAAISAGRPAAGLKWLNVFPDRDPAADLLRGKALLALGQTRDGRSRLERVVMLGTREQRTDADLSMIEAAGANGSPVNADLQKRLDRIRYTWRGGRIEERALRLAWRLAMRANDSRRAIMAGATLFRYFALGADTAPMAAAIQAQIGAALAPGSTMPLQDAAGLYWDYRDLTPSGADGDRLVGQFADRLAAAGLYARAAELLGYQLTARVRDIAQGPLSVRVATLQILAGRPDRALSALQDTDGVAYPQEMLWDRRRVGAAALHLLGKTAEALAVLQDVPGGRGIAAEILWKTQDWVALVTAGQPTLPGAGPLNEVGQAVVLRQAIALAMLGREDELSKLRVRYGRAFSGAPSASAFDVLTSDVSTLDPGAVGRAMAALPSASPAGKIADLLDVDVIQPKPGAG